MALTPAPPTTRTEHNTDQTQYTDRHKCNLTRSTLTDTRSNSRETDSRKRTDICQATPTDAPPPSLSPLRPPREVVLLRHPHCLLRAAFRLLSRLPLVLPIRPNCTVLYRTVRNPTVLYSTRYSQRTDTTVRGGQTRAVKQTTTRFETDNTQQGPLPDAPSASDADAAQGRFLTI